MKRSIVILIVSLICSGLCGCATTPKAEDHYQTIARDPHRDTDAARQLNALAIAAIDRNDWASAEDTLKKALDDDVTFGPAHNNLGKVYYHQKDLYRSAWEFQYAAKLMPYQPEPRNNLGLVFEAAGKLDDAVKWYDEAVKIEPENPQLVGNDARARIRRGDHDSATRELLEKVVAGDTRSSWNNWARERLALMGATTPATQPAMPLP